MNPTARRTPSLPGAPRALAASRGAVGHVADALHADELPSLAQILEHFRRHGTVARTVAAEVSVPPPPDEAIAGLHTRELEGPTLFDEFFGPPER
ncbi:MAG: hypothetical protein HY855_05265 [Burkholderiales bacterium]|nr:hypothetical protein [Burkholderiales bacterium]